MKKQQNTHPIDIYAIIENGGATLDKSGFEVNFLRGYQVSKHDIAILKASEAEKIARTISKLLKRIARNEFVGVWVNEGRVYVDISEHVNSQGARAVKFPFMNGQRAIVLNVKRGTKKCIKSR